MKKPAFTSSVIFLGILIYFNFFQTPGNKSKTNTGTKDSVSNITLAVVGDIMCHSVQYNYAKINKDSFDFFPVYRYVKQYLEEVDFTWGNLETVTAGKKKQYSGYPFFNSPDEFITALKESGFDLLTTSNNHSADKGEEGILRTIEQLELNNLDYNGTFVSASDRDSIRIFNIGGINIAFLAYTYGLNGNVLPKGKNYLVNLIDTVLIKEDIQKARSKDAELVIVHYHFGEEYKRVPTIHQKELVRTTIAEGADIIIGGHPHVMQPAEMYKTLNAALDTGFTAYSLGNFLSNQRWRYSDAGVILLLNIIKNHVNDSIYIDKVEYLPTWVYKGRTERGNEYLILPSELYDDTTISFLSKSDRMKMRQAFEDTKEILTGRNKRIFVKKISKNK